MDPFPMSAEAWSQGLTLEAFVDGMHSHQAATRRLAQVALRRQDQLVFGRLSGWPHALIMTEDWCGDSLLNLPILARVVAAVPGMDLRIFVRSRWPQLEAFYRARAVTHIPVFSCLDATFQEPVTWVERPQAAQARLDAWYAAHPAVLAVRSDASLDPDIRRQRLRELTAGLLDEMEGWYDTGGLQQATVDEIEQLLML